jgi:hypothetical protein
VRKAVILFTSSLFLYCLLRDVTLLKLALLCGVIGFAYVISKIPSKYLAGAKYPLIGLSLAASPALILYPGVRLHLMVAAGAVLLTFYSVALFLVTLEEKPKKHHMEVVGLSVLYAAAFVNLLLTRHFELFLPLSVSVLLFLFIANRARIMPFAAGLTLVAVVALEISGVALLGGVPWPNAAERYVLLATAFALLLIGFVGFVRRPDFINVLVFFGVLYVSIDLLMSVGFRLKGILLQQPVLALFVVSPIVGMALKGGNEKP